MQVPAVAAQVMEWVSIGDPDAPTLMRQIKTIKVFKAYPAEARVHSPRATPGEWWVWGIPGNAVPWQTLSQLVREAQQFFLQNQVSLQRYENTLIIIIHCSQGIMAFLAYSKSMKPRGWGWRISNYKHSIS